MRLTTQKSESALSPISKIHNFHKNCEYGNSKSAKEKKNPNRTVIKF